MKKTMFLCLLFFPLLALAQITGGVLIPPFLQRGILLCSRNLANNSDTTLMDIPLFSGQGLSGFLLHECKVLNGTDSQLIQGYTSFTAVNKGGVYTTNITPGGLSAVVSAGTMTDTWSITTGSNVIHIVLNINSSLANITTERIIYRLHIYGADGTDSVTID